MEKRILSLIIALSFMLTALPVAYASESEQGLSYVISPKVVYTNDEGEVIDTIPDNGIVNATLDLKYLANENNITFVTAVYEDGYMIAKKSSKKLGSEESLTNNLTFTLSDVSKAKIKSFIIDNYKTGKNILNCAELGSSNNNLKGLWYNNLLVNGFNKLVSAYSETIPASVTKYPQFIFKAEDSGIKTEIKYPAELSGIDEVIGTVEITTTANNGDTKSYNVTMTREKAEVTNADIQYSDKPVVLGNPLEQPDFGGNDDTVIANCTNPINPVIGQKWIIGTLDEKLVGATLITLPYRSVDPGKSDMEEYLDKTGFITFDINRSATVYVSWTKQAATPEWIANEGFEDVSSKVENKIMTADNKFSNMKFTYKKHFEVAEWSNTPVKVSLGGTDTFGYWMIFVVFDK